MAVKKSHNNIALSPWNISTWDSVGESVKLLHEFIEKIDPVQSAELIAWLNPQLKIRYATLTQATNKFWKGPIGYPESYWTQTTYTNNPVVYITATHTTGTLFPFATTTTYQGGAVAIPNPPIYTYHYGSTTKAYNS